MKLIDQLNLDDVGRRMLMLYCCRQAATQFEVLHRYREAAECWEGAGEIERAVALLLQQRDSTEAARLLWRLGRYREALDCYERWLEQSAPTDVTAKVQAQLGIAACCERLNEDSARQQTSYRQARATLDAADLSARAKGECWRAVGEYGSRVGRWDLIHLGYEQALRQYAGEHQRLPAVLREYAAAVPGNRTLEERLQEQLAEYATRRERPLKPEGEALRAATAQVREVRRFQGHTGWVNTACFSADGRLLASGSRDGTVRLWNPDTGEELRILQGRVGDGHTVTFSPDGRLLASGGKDGTARLWSPETGREVLGLQGHQGEIHAVDFSADGQLLATGGHDNTVRLWRSDTGEELRCLEGHEGTVWSVSFPANSRLVASGSSDQTVRLWNPDTGEELRRLEGHEGTVWCASFFPDGQMLASGGTDGSVRLWNANTGQELRRFDGHSEVVYVFSISPDGRVLASHSQDGTVCFWDTASGSRIMTIEKQVLGGMHGSAFSRDGRYFVSVMGASETLGLFDVSALELAPD